MQPKPKSEEIMILISDLLDLEAWYWTNWCRKEIDEDRKNYYIEEQKKLFKQIINLIHGKGGGK